MASSTRSAAARLLGDLLAERVFAPETLAVHLGVSTAILDEYREGRLTIPLDRQRRLADVVIQHAPSHARVGYRLRGQVTAAIAYESGATETHLNDPPMSRRT